MVTVKPWLLLVMAAVVALTIVSGPVLASGPAAPAAPLETPQRWVVIMRSGIGLAGASVLRDEITKAGAQVVINRPEVNLMVVTSTNPQFQAQMAGNPRVESVGRDHVEQLVRPALQQELLGQPFNANATRTRIAIDGSKIRNTSLASLGLAAFSPDPANNLLGLMWDMQRVKANQVWALPGGLGPGIFVGVADTGLDYTHADLAGRVSPTIYDLTKLEGPPLCKTYFGTSDADLATTFGAPSDNLDFNGHGTWIGGNIAATANMTGVNGIAPRVTLVSLKISQWCGYAYDSTILEAFLTAANHFVDIVSISFGGYLDRTDPDQNAIYNLYVRVVQYAKSKGTMIVAAAGNEHARIGTGGLVTSHGILDVPPGGTDYYGLWEVPGGIPGVVDVSATSNVVNAASATCPADSLTATTHQWCKPASDAHQSPGVGLKNQLTYYSNYGPEIDLAGPGGARKFNIPSIDRGGAEGWPWTGIDSVFGGTSVTDGYNAWEDFNITSNWATQIPCFTFTGSTTFPDNQCYAIIQGTSMATPHVSAVAALTASKIPALRHHPDALLAYLKAHATVLANNKMTTLSATDFSAGDTGGSACPGGYCHLGTWVISNANAYGAGLVNAKPPFGP